MRLPGNTLPTGALAATLVASSWLAAGCGSSAPQEQPAACVRTFDQGAFVGYNPGDVALVRNGGPCVELYGVPLMTFRQVGTIPTGQTVQIDCRIVGAQPAAYEVSQDGRITGATLVGSTALIHAFSQLQPCPPP